MTPTTIVLKDIVQEYPHPETGGPVRIVDSVSLTLSAPSITMFLGPSGCGKSTIMKMMGGVRPFGTQTPTSGQVTIDGVPCDSEHPDVIMVFQQYANRPDLTVRENVEFPFQFKLWRDRVPSKEERKARVDAILERVGLTDRQNNYPSQLSGGQNQRLALAQSLVLRPRILLMDEPFGALDAQTRQGMQELLVELWREAQCLIVFVTHDITEALTLGSRIVVYSTKPATVAADIEITQPHGDRADWWLRGPAATAISNQIINVLRAQEGRGQVRVSV